MINRTTISLISGLLLIPVNVQAAGTNFFLQGLYHPMMVPAQLIALFALALLIGQQGQRSLCRVPLGFVLALSLSLLATRYYTPSWNSELVLLPLAALTGLLVILKREWPLQLSMLLAILIATVVGLDSAVPMIPGLQARKIYASLAGSGLTITSLLVLVSIVSFFLRNILQGIALRVLGAWSTAGAILVLTLLLAPITLPN